MYDCCVYLKIFDDGSFIFLLLYVDDMLIATNHLYEVNELKDLGAAKKILSMKFHRDMSARSLRLSEKRYVENVLDIFDISNWKVVSTPMANHFKSSLDQHPKIVQKLSTCQRFCIPMLLVI